MDIDCPRNEGAYCYTVPGTMVGAFETRRQQWSLDKCRGFYSSQSADGYGQSLGKNGKVAPRSHGQFHPEQMARRFPAEIREYLEELASATDPGPPRNALKKVRERFGQLIKATNGSQLTDQKIKSKFTSLKREVRKL